MTAILNILAAAFSASGARTVVVTRHGMMVYLYSDDEIVRIASEQGLEVQMRRLAGQTWLALDVQTKDGSLTLIGPDHAATESEAA